MDDSPQNSASQEAVGESEAFVEFQQRLSQAARVDRSVLVIGERGSGKELAASRLHYLSARWNAPYVALNCAALSPGLIESELFGHESGSFTGSTGRRKGRFEEAHGGTLFLDEIGLVPLEVQEKILRAVEYGTFQRVGSSSTVEVNVRIIGATNQDLPTLCESGVFKRDLLDRLSFEVLFLPPLRRREEDILLLARHFAAGMSREIGRENTPRFSEKALRQLREYHWPGNVRELKNTVERAAYREEGRKIQELTLNPFHNPWDDAARMPPDLESRPWPRDLKAAVHDLEHRWIREALERAEGHQGKAAELLGLSYDQFRNSLRKHNVRFHT